MISTEELQFLSAIGTLLLAIAAFIGVFYPRIIAFFYRPKIEILPEIIGIGDGGLKFSVNNIGKSPARKTIATIKVVTYQGDVLGQWIPPWKLYSNSKEGMIEVKYDSTTIYPGQRVYLGGFERLDIDNNPVIGLNAPPYIVGARNFPDIYWEFSPLSNGEQAPLKKEENYFVTISVYCEEYSHGVSLLLLMKWSNAINGIFLENRKVFYEKYLKIEEKLWKKNKIKPK